MKTQYRENKLLSRLLSVSEVADFLVVHPSTVRRWGKKGLLKSYTSGLRHNLRFKQGDVLNFQKDLEKELGYRLLNWLWLELKTKAPVPWHGSHMKASPSATARSQRYVLISQESGTL